MKVTLFDVAICWSTLGGPDADEWHLGLGFVRSQVHAIR
jgi:hypothetical protein